MAIGVAMLAASGCTAERDPPEVTVSWLAPQSRPAKPIDCQLPQLSDLPNADFQEIANIEVVDDYHADDQEIYSLARRKACETGADALVILEDQRQERGRPVPGSAEAEQHEDKPVTDTPQVGEVGHKGRVLTAVAIIYKNRSSSTAAGTGSQ